MSRPRRGSAFVVGFQVTRRPQACVHECRELVVDTPQDSARRPEITQALDSLGGPRQAFAVEIPLLRVVIHGRTGQGRCLLS